MEEVAKERRERMKASENKEMDVREKAREEEGAAPLKVAMGCRYR